MTDRDDVEETVMLTRRDRRRAGVQASADATASSDEPDGPSADDEQTSDDDPSSHDEQTSHDEADAADEATVVVDRSQAGAAGVAGPTGAAEETDAADEATVVVARAPRRSRRGGEPASVEPAAVEQASAEPAAVEPFSAPAGPTPSIYKPRPAPQGASAPPVVVGAVAPTRTDDPERPSVAKQARRWSVFTLAAFSAACVVSVAGLVGVGFLALG